MKKQIKFTSLERFNLEDANDLQGLVDQQLTLQNYGLKGGANNATLTGGMILSPFSCASVGTGNSTPTAYIVLNPFTFMLPNGEIIEHTNSALQISYSTLRSSAIAAGTAKIGYLWGNYNIVNTENESREFWSPLDQAEIIQNVDTRTVKTPTFVITTTSGQPAAIDGRLWTRLAYITTNTAGTVATTSAVIQYNEMPGMQYYKPLEITSSTTSRRFGLGTYWDNIEEMFYKIITNGSIDPSDKTTLAKGAFPQYSLQGLKREVEKRERFGVVATATLVFKYGHDTVSQAQRDGMTSAVSVAQGSGATLEECRQARYDYYNDVALNPINIVDETSLESLIRLYSDADIIGSELLGCHFEDETGAVINNINNIFIFKYDADTGVFGSQSLARLVVDEQNEGASANLINSIRNLNKIEIQVTPNWYQTAILGNEANNYEYRTNINANNLVFATRRFNDVIDTNSNLAQYNEYKNFFVTDATTTNYKVYTDVDFTFCSPFSFITMNEHFFRSSSLGGQTSPVALAPQYITVNIKIYGDLSYV